MISKPKKTSIAGLALLGLLCSGAQAATNNHQQTAPENNQQAMVYNSDGFYLGAFGGYGAPMHNNLSQTGTAFFTPSLAVNAKGTAHESSGGGWGGLHVGYEWAPMVMSPCWALVPAAELEAYYLGVTESGDLINSNVAEHDFYDSFPMHTWVIMADTVWALKVPQWSDVLPYISAGVGAADVSISGANSLQTSPAEPGINHFNSNTQASKWAFAAQAKAGMRFNIDTHWRIFAEYRYLYIASTNYTFGSTQYPTHVATTNWNVGIGGMSNNMGALGVEYSV